MSEHPVMQMAADSVKRAMDVVGSITALIVTLPLMGVIATTIWIAMGRPILYGQVRPGLHEHRFRIWKFRTMTEARNAEGHLLPDSERLTPLGRWLREFSLDELPQLLNVLIGDMSLVGPRPLLVRYIDRYTDRQRRRHDVKPGITGWAQVNGRNAVDWETRLEHDVWYVENGSLVVDCRILFLTLQRLWLRSDVLAGAGADLDEFWGTLGVPQNGPRAFPVEADEQKSL
jgi:lipopolysaccharide/colanic/teichoic acid biosynthesis glycosyltransferase